MWHSVFLAAALAASSSAGVDADQAHRMLSFLDRCAKTHHADAAALDALEAAAGTALVVAQQNVSRHVDMRQYRAVLAAACEGKAASVAAADEGPRGARGAEGLRQDVIPSLLWGLHHVPELRDHLAQLAGRATSIEREAAARVRRSLPEKGAADARLHIVMGGRAGAAAIGNDLYVDLLVSDWRAATGAAPPLTRREAVDYFAHEMHHIVYGAYLARLERSLRLNAAEAQAWSLLKAVIMEGSATLLVNYRGDLRAMERSTGFAKLAGREPGLIADFQSVLREALDGPLSETDFQRRMDTFAGNALHMTGARILADIARHQGREGVMAALRDPRSLLARFGRSQSADAGAIPVDASLSARLAKMGRSG